MGLCGAIVEALSGTAVHRLPATMFLSLTTGAQAGACGKQLGSASIRRKTQISTPFALATNFMLDRKLGRSIRVRPRVTVAKTTLESASVKVWSNKRQSRQ